MNRTRMLSRNSLLAALVLLASLGCHATGMAQADRSPSGQQPEERFDLIIYGFDFDPGEHEVFLRTNPDFGTEWVSLGTLEVTSAPGSARDDWSVVVFPHLATDRFLGQDFRESYLDVRIVTHDGSDGSNVSAIYALPHTGLTADAEPQIRRLIENDPFTIERLSLASHVQPRPASLQADAEYIEHVRAPMKHTRPGVMEVRQLEVEWRNRGGG